MSETLLSPSNVLLYGRILSDLVLQHPAPPPAAAASSSKAKAASVAAASSDGGFDEPVPQPPDAPPKLGGNKFLQQQLTAGTGKPNESPRLARIYGFSYEGHYYDLARPAIFLVHGPGNDPEAFRPGTARVDSRGDRAPADADRTGVASTASSFSHDMRVWSYDKGDFSLRLDPESGPLEQILLQAELRPERQQTYYSGQNAFISGQNVFLRGGRGRMTGD